jgi:RHS repeat-associated protein
MVWFVRQLLVAIFPFLLAVPLFSNGNYQLGTDTYDYDAFGNLIHSTGTTPNNYLFAGEQFDPDLNLYYNRARYLNVSTGRFWSVDTDEGKDEQPLSLHKYLYAGGDSVNKSDPSGHDFSIVEALTVAVVITVLAAIPTAHDSIGTGTPTYEPPFEKVTKDPKLGFFKQFRVMIHTQGDANRFLVVQWVKGSLTRDGHYGILDIHQGEPNYPYYFPNWVIDSASQLAEYPGYPPGPDVTSLTKNGAWIKFYDEPQSDPGAHSYTASLDFRVNVYDRLKVSNSVSAFRGVDDPKPLLSIPWGFHDSYVVP